MSHSRVRLSADIGGTFTDLVIELADGTRVTTKVLTTPTAPERAVLDGASGLLAHHGLGLKDVDVFVHGTTLATNAVLERRGAVTALITTEGFRDVLEIGRTNRPVLYDIRTQKAPPLVPRTRAIEVDERLLFDGSVLHAMDVAEVERLAERIPNGRNVAAPNARKAAPAKRAPESRPSQSRPESGPRGVQSSRAG